MTTDEMELQRWFPGLYRKGTGTKCTSPKLRVICFPPAGCAEDLFSTEGTGARFAPSPLIAWCKANEAELLAVQYPGRANRKEEEFAASIQDIAAPLHSVLSGYCNDGVPYAILAHSVGTWVAYELLALIAEKDTLAMPEHVFFSSFPPPTISTEERPWKRNDALSEEQFKMECRRWDINEAVFGIWDVYQPLLRADFSLFDQYAYNHADAAPKFAFPMTVFSAKDDRMITHNMCRGWKDITTGSIELQNVNSHHLFPLEKEPKLRWLKEIVKGLEDMLEDVELKREYEGMGV